MEESSKAFVRPPARNPPTPPPWGPPRVRSPASSSQDSGSFSYNEMPSVAQQIVDAFETVVNLLTDYKVYLQIENNDGETLVKQLISKKHEPSRSCSSNNNNDQNEIIIEKNNVRNNIKNLNIPFTDTPEVQKSISEENHVQGEVLQDCTQSSNQKLVSSDSLCMCNNIENSHHNLTSQNTTECFDITPSLSGDSEKAAISESRLSNAVDLDDSIEMPNLESEVPENISEKIQPTDNIQCKIQENINQDCNETLEKESLKYVSPEHGIEDSNKSQKDITPPTIENVLNESNSDVSKLQVMVNNTSDEHTEQCDGSFDNIVCKEEPMDEAENNNSYVNESVTQCEVKIEKTEEDEIFECTDWPDDIECLPHFTSIPEGQKEATTLNVLSIRTWPIPLPQMVDFDLTKLQRQWELQSLKFKASLEDVNIFKFPANWILNSAALFSQGQLSCPDCKYTTFLGDSKDLLDDVRVICGNKFCGKPAKFKRPKVFSKFGMPLRNIVLLMYHWTVQSKVEIVLESVSKAEGREEKEDENEAAEKETPEKEIAEKKAAAVKKGAKKKIAGKKSTGNKTAEEQQRTLACPDNFKTSLSAMTVEEVWHFYKTLQNACKNSFHSPLFQLGGNLNVVEASIIKFGIFYILGAYDRTKLTFRLKAYPVTNQWDLSVIQQQLQDWIQPQTVLVTPFSNIELMDVTSYPVNNHTDMNVGCIETFLIRVIQHLFGEFCTALLPIETIQGFLDEIVFRHVLAKSPSSAFSSILYDLMRSHSESEDTETEITLKHLNPAFKEAGTQRAMLYPGEFIITYQRADNRRLSKNSTTKRYNSQSSLLKKKLSQTKLTSKNSVKNSNDLNNQILCPDVSTETSHSDTSNSITSKRNAGVKRKDLAGPESAKNKLMRMQTNLLSSNTIVQVNELDYYARIGVASINETRGATPGNGVFFKCESCPTTIWSSGYMIEHYINIHYKELRTQFLGKEFHQCNQCLSEFDTLTELKNHEQEIHNLNATSCLICSRPFLTKDHLLSHLKDMHIPFEMPYSCKLCNFRSSLYIDVRYHIFKEHSYALDLICLFCLRKTSYNLDDGLVGNVNYSKHLVRHSQQNGEGQCPKCSLIFLTKKHFDEHQIKDHAPFRSPSLKIVKFLNRLPLHKSETPREPPKRKTISVVHPKISTSSFNLTFDCSNQSYKCYECHGILNAVHFKQFRACDTCSYKTHCHDSYFKHLRYHHKKRTIISTDTKFICSCNFCTLDGDDMASHLLNCDGQCFTVMLSPGPPVLSPQK